MGSLPRVWEKGAAETIGSSPIGITPTCVGKSAAAIRTMASTEDHSHVCGKKTRTGTASTGILGSLPRVWEKALVLQFLISASRITPTCVGKRLSIYGQNKHFVFILS